MRCGISLKSGNLIQCKLLPYLLVKTSKLLGSESGSFEFTMIPVAAFTFQELAKSNSKEVTLVNVERGSSGKFKCEVTADAPLFHTDMQIANVIVADVPSDVPVLKTETQKVAPGGQIRANCTTPGSYPAVNITWSLNGLNVSIRPQLILLMEYDFHYLFLN
ncbi:hypothetical protein JTB14_017926 [Gonioctena quinquepunctata]|nr:hypothetical protein JTB14_017926 [Gonioctena quinquepunctata]